MKRIVWLSVQNGKGVPETNTFCFCDITSGCVKKIEIPVGLWREEPTIAMELPTTSSRGRPPIPFEEASTKTKKRRVQDLLCSRSPEELIFAAHVVKSSCAVSEPTGHSSVPMHNVIALYLDLDLSERKYTLLQKFVNGLHNNCLPNIKSFENLKCQYCHRSQMLRKLPLQLMFRIY